MVGTPIAGRTTAETEALIGLFVNTLALRLDLSGSPDFLELLGRVRETALAAYAHQELPFERLVEELAPERDLSRPPLVQAMLVLQNAPAGALALPGLELEATPVGNGAAVFELTFNFVEIPGGGLAGTIDYNRDLFDAATIARLAGHFERLLAAAVAAPETAVADLRLLSDAERRELLAEWGPAAQETPRLTTLDALFAAQVARAPETSAIVFAGEEITYRDLDARAGRWALHLRRLGAGPETIVGVCLAPSPDFVVALLAVWRAGGAFLPLDPAYPAERLAFMLEDSGAPLVLTRDGLMGADVAGVRRVLLDDLETPAAEDASRPGAGRHPSAGPRLRHLHLGLDRPAQRGRGAAGRGGGALRSHRRGLGLEPRDRVLQFASPSFDTWLEETVPPLISGATLVPRGAELWEPARFLDKIPRAGPHRGRAADGVLAPVGTGGPGDGDSGNRCESPAAPGVDRRRGDARRGGPPLAALAAPRHPPGQLLRADGGDRHRHLLPGRRRRGRGGHRVAGAAARRPQRPGPGPPGALVPAGVPGELCLGGALLARGYLHRPDLTAERFVPDPFSPVPGGRLYRTGDLVRAAGGRLEYLGRVDQQVKVRGYRIELGEIEAALQDHGDVRSAVVLARADSSGGGSLVAWVESESDRVSAAELRQLLKGRLPEHMVPSAFGFVESMPRTPNGKVAWPWRAGGNPGRGAADAHRGAGGGDLRRGPEAAAGGCPTTTSSSWAATRCWRRRSPRGCGRRSEWSCRCGRCSRRRRSPRSRAVSSPRWLVAEGLPPITRVSRDRRLELSFAQARLWFLDRLAPDKPVLQHLRRRPADG